MELLEAFYRRKLRKKQKKSELGRSDGALCRTPSEASVNGLATGLISKVLRFTSRRSDPASRPHSWHSTKLVEVQQEADPGTMDTMSNAWHHGYHPSASTTDLSSGFDSGTYLRKSPDQYSSRGSMESLDQPVSSQHHPGSQHHHHPLGRHSHSSSHPTYSSCHQLSSARSSNSIDLLHSKRDSAYSSFSTSSSIPEYLASTPSFSPERSYSLEVVSHRGGGSGEMQQADMCYGRTHYDGQQGLSPEHEIRSASAALTCNSSSSRSSSGAPPSQSRDGRVSGVCYRGSSSGSSSGGSSSSGSGATASNRHSVGPIWGPSTATCSSYENLKGAPAPPRRSDSYAAIRNHERPNSWSSLEQGRSLRSLQKGSWHHSSGPLASGAAKGPYGTEGHLHTVIEKSPESSPTTKPRQGGGFPAPHCPPETLSGPAGTPTAQSGQYILPTGKYQVPQPEPHYAHIPSSSQSGPGSSSVYSALMKESSRQQQQQQQQKLHGVRGGHQEVASDDHWEERTSAAENGFQTNSASLCNSSSTSAPSQLRPHQQVEDRPQHEESKSEHHRSYSKPESQAAVAQRTQNHPGRHSQNSKGSYTQAPQGTYSQTYQEQNQDLRHLAAQPTTPGRRTASPPEWRDPYTLELCSGGRRRSLDQNSVSSEPAVPTTRTPARAQPQAPPPSTSHHPPCHLSDSAALQYQQLDQHQREHPLTRLANALAEVQRCPTPDSQSEGGHGPARSLSVLEKVSRFERRERAGLQHSSSSSSSSKGAHLRMSEKGRGSTCGADDLRNMLERSTSAAKAQRTSSFRGGGSETYTYRGATDPSSALQRSRSSFQLKDSRRGDAAEDLNWRQDIQERVGTTHDASYNRSYRDRVKDAQSRVLRSTSLRRRDLSSSVSPPPPAAADSGIQHSPSGQARPQPAEKRGPKTMPKPQGIFVPPHSPPPTTTAPAVTSPHTPKERHLVSPDLRGLDPPALPSVPPVGPPALLRICGRKRLAAGQKKRSYSEPENLNEVGVSDPETVALFRRGGETSVADRRRMFELAATRTADAASRTDLRQLQHDALAEYMERKKGLKREEGQQRGVARPRSAYLLPDSSSQMMYQSDAGSLSSTSSLLSLQESTDRSCSPAGRRVHSTLPPGGDLRSFESNVFYPGRVTTPRPPAHSQLSGPTGAPADFKAQALQDVAPAAQPCGQVQHSQTVSKTLNGALQRAQSTRHSGRSASAEDLLERCEEKPIVSQHLRSRSSPTGDKLVQDFPTSDVRTFGAFVSEPNRHSLLENRPADAQASAAMPSHSPGGLSSSSSTQPGDASHDAGSSHLSTPVTRRERPARRSSERPRTSGASTLAASVGLPCPFSPPGAPNTVGDGEWHLNQRLDQANLDAIAFPGLMHTSEESGGGVGGEGGGVGGEGGAEACREERLSSLRISESNLFAVTTETMPLLEDSDEVFLQDPPPPPPLPPLPPPPPLIETHALSVEDLPLPPPPSTPPPILTLNPETTRSAAESCTSPATTLPPSTPHPAPSVVLQQREQDSAAAEQNLALDYQPLPRREKTSEELRVEMLARQLVLQDGSLAPLYDMYGGKSTLELMEEIFSNKVVGRSPWQRRSSRRLDDRLLDGVNDLVKEHQETNLDEVEKDLNTKKLELCEALRRHLEALQLEKEELREELRRHQVLGAGVEALVQERLKANERDKYSVFIGDLEKIVNLLLSLCSRLSRIDRSLLALEGEELTREGAAEERDSLLHKRSLLLAQTDDARELKENLERRQRVVHAILSAHLGGQQLQDYRCFVSAKPSLLVRQRHLDNLLRQAEEQLALLRESLPLELVQGLSGGGGVVLAPSPAPCPALVVAPAPLHRPTAVTSL